MSPVYVAGAVAVLGLIAPRSPSSNASRRASHRDVVLSASASFPNPMQDVDLTAVLSGPNGQELIVPGFWDGGRTFRIRFTLTAPGDWSYMTVSSDPELDAQSGIIEAGPAVAARTFTTTCAPPGAASALGVRSGLFRTVRKQGRTAGSRGAARAGHHRRQRPARRMGGRRRALRPGSQIRNPQSARLRHRRIPRRPLRGVPQRDLVRGLARQRRRAPVRAPRSEAWCARSIPTSRSATGRARSLRRATAWPEVIGSDLAAGRSDRGARAIGVAGAGGRGEIPGASPTPARRTLPPRPPHHVARRDARRRSRPRSPALVTCPSTSPGWGRSRRSTT